MTQPTDKTFPPELGEYLEDFDSWVRGGKTPDDAALSSKRFGLSPQQCQLLKDEYLRRNRRFIDFTDPRVLRGNRQIESWYSGPEFAGAWCWPEYKAMLLAPEKAWEASDFKSLDDASTKILATLPHPGKSDFNCRGLVVGYVQSGKTANYSALISKAADVGYRLFIVLAGTTSSLRQQTQGRLNKDVVNHSPANWTWLTYPESDFPGNPARPDALIDVQSHRKRVIAVVKKNVKILDRLIAWLKSASSDTLSACPAIIIDDEADNASVNTNDPDVDPTAINERIRQLLKSLKKVAYVGYTATPFANIFIDPGVHEDLFPRDFIFDLDRPKAYFGAERIFGRSLLWFDASGEEPEGMDVVRSISTKKPDEPSMLVPARAKDRFDFAPKAPESLILAIQYFLLATAARYARGQSAKHSSMLVHTTMYVTLHDRMQGLLDGYLKTFKSNWKKSKEGLEELWDSEVGRAPIQGTPTTSFEQLWAHMPTVLERASVVVDNGRAESTLKYDDNRPAVVIAVGGNTFSRGLTLEGLVVSYYLRRAGAYDTLLQMGRWFGYRPGYGDLPRIWMTEELEQQFFFLASVEEEIRQDIRRLEKEQKTPLELAIRVRTHPKLTITARNRMGAARLTSASFSDRRLQSFLFRHDDGGWLEKNHNAALELVKALPTAPMPDRKGRYLTTGVPVATILNFLRTYRFHELHDELQQELIEKYILAENAQGALNAWSIGWMGQQRQQPELGSMDLGLPSPLNCINRTRFKTTEPCNIKALMSRPDRGFDVAGAPVDASDEELVALRNAKRPGEGLLLLYPIAKNSAPLGDKKHVFGKCTICGDEHQIPKEGVAVRHPLKAVRDVVGAALVFPRSLKAEASYMANQLGDLFKPGDFEEGEVVPNDAPELDK